MITRSNNKDTNRGDRVGYARVGSCSGPVFRFHSGERSGFKLSWLSSTACLQYCAPTVLDTSFTSTVRFLFFQSFRTLCPRLVLDSDSKYHAYRDQQRYPSRNDIVTNIFATRKLVTNRNKFDNFQVDSFVGHVRNTHLV